MAVTHPEVLGTPPQPGGWVAEARRTLGRFFHEEIAEPLRIDFYIGLPSEVPDERLAQLRTFTARRSLQALPHTPPGYVLRILCPWSLLRKSMLFADVAPQRSGLARGRGSAGNGVGTARAIARAYSAFAEGGTDLGITPQTLAELMAPHDVERKRDQVMGTPSWLSLGFLKPGPQLIFGTSQSAFGTPAPAARSASPTQPHGSPSPT